MATRVAPTGVARWPPRGARRPRPSRRRGTGWPRGSVRRPWPRARPRQRGRIGPNWAASTTSSGRNRLPPAAMMCAAASVTNGVRPSRGVGQASTRWRRARSRRTAQSLRRQPMLERSRLSSLLGGGQAPSLASADEVPARGARSSTGPGNTPSSATRQRRTAIGTPGGGTRPWPLRTPATGSPEEHQHDDPDVEERRDHADQHSDDHQPVRSHRVQAAAKTAHLPMKPRSAGCRRSSAGTPRRCRPAAGERVPGPTQLDRCVASPVGSRTMVTIANAPTWPRRTRPGRTSRTTLVSELAGPRRPGTPDERGHDEARVGDRGVREHPLDVGLGDRQHRADRHGGHRDDRHQRLPVPAGRASAT